MSSWVNRWNWPPELIARVSRHIVSVLCPRPYLPPPRDTQNMLAVAICTCELPGLAVHPTSECERHFHLRHGQCFYEVLKFLCDVSMSPPLHSQTNSLMSYLSLIVGFRPQATTSIGLAGTSMRCGLESVRGRWRRRGFSTEMLRFGQAAVVSSCIPCYLQGLRRQRRLWHAYGVAAWAIGLHGGAPLRTLHTWTVCLSEVVVHCMGTSGMLPS